MADSTIAPNSHRTLLGHPIGLYTLFFTEMWERFSFYGMKALLILYMVEYFVWSQEDASYVLALYAGLVYCTPVLGGLIADRFIGARRAVVIGGILIALGHLSLAFEPLPSFFSGLILLILGVGLLKPNISTQVGSMYRQGDPRRDSAFTIFYMGINVGAFLGTLVCPWLRITYGWHYGFGAAAVGMCFGLIMYLLGQRFVFDVEADTESQQPETKPTEPMAPPTAPETLPVQEHVQRDRIVVLVVVCLFAFLFWMCFEQMANAMTRWASDQTNLRVFQLETVEAGIDAAAEVAPTEGSWRDWEIPPEQTQAINPFFILAFGALFSWLWIWLDRRNKQPSSPAKMGMGVFLMGLAWVVMLLAAQGENRPSSAPLASLPEDVNLEDYGATRLHYDPETQTLHMNGVLPDLDRIRLLGGSASEEYQQIVEQLVQKAAERPSEVPSGQEWEVRETIPASFPIPDSVALHVDSVQWDAASRALIATDKVPERDELRVLALGAEPEFRAAVNSIYQQSSLYRVNVSWLVFHYMLLTLGELCLSPVGLSLVTKLAPPKHVGLFMGLWFFTTGGMANFTAHFIGSAWGKITPIWYFMIFAAVSFGATLLMLLILRSLKRGMHGVQ